MTNALYYGDNLGYLREMDRECVDLVYLDPPFNSNANYNLLFKSKGNAVQAQTTAFQDTWSWLEPAERAFNDVLASGSPVTGFLSALRSSMGDTNIMAYLAMMTVRLIEMRRALKPTGSLYLHCDPTASHYLKIILDAIFGSDRFLNEIVWQRTGAHNDARRFGRITDTILFYSRSPQYTFNPQYEEYDPAYLEERYRYRDPDGRRFWANTATSPSPRPNMMYEWKGNPSPPNGWRFERATMERMEREGRLYYSKSGMVYAKNYLDEQKGRAAQNLWTDIPMSKSGSERLGYPTQKPIALLDRIIRASTNPGDIVLDPFCGCGTSIEAAERAHREWIGIDITHHAIDVVEGRLKAHHPLTKYEVKGRPADLESAQRLAKNAPYEFQWWANWKLGVQSYREQKKGPDKGIDGIIHFYNVPHGAGQIIVSVKAGQNIGPDMIDGLAGTVRREGAQLGLFVCAGKPTDRMRQRAAGQGLVHIGQKAYPVIQIVTADDLVDDRIPNLPRVIETSTLRETLRPSKPAKSAPPSPQLTLALPIEGKKKSADMQVHLSGALLAELASTASG